VGDVRCGFLRIRESVRTIRRWDCWTRGDDV